MTTTYSSPAASVLPDLAAALQDELEALKKIPRESTLFSGEFVGSFAGRFYYRFEIPEHLLLHGAGEATFSLGQIQPISMHGTIVALENQYLTAALPMDLGPVIPELRCSWNFELRLEPAVESLKSAVPSPVAAILLNPTGENNLHGIAFEPHFLPTTPPDQQNALKKIFQNKVTFVWGPILSGKTHLLAHIASNYIKAGKKILFVATVNERVDDVLERSIDIGQQLGVDMRHQTCSLGLPSVENFDALGAISFEQQIESMKVEKRKSFQERVSLLEKYWKVRIRQVLHSDHTARLHEMRTRLSEKKKQIDHMTAELAPFKETINHIQNSSMMDKLKKGFGKEDLAAAHKKLEEKQSAIKRLQSALTGLTQESLKLEAYNPIGGEDLKEFKLAVKAIDELGGIEKVQEAVDQYTAVHEGDLLQSKQFIGTTVTTALSDRRLRGIQFDMIMVDDAEIIPIPVLVALAGMAKEKIVISGDPYQVGPEPLSNSGPAEQWLGRDIFLHMAKTDQLNKLFDFSEQHPEWCILLSSHFATTAKLSLFMGSVLFDEKINVFASPTAKGKIFFIDSTNLKTKARQYVGRKKILPYNDVHTKKVLELVKHALLEPGRMAADVGVILPFTGPALYTKQQLRIHGIQNVEVGTPHSFRGRRKKAVIFDTTMAGVDYTMRTIDDKKVGEHQIVRLLTTVFSCVEEDLYVVADMSHFMSLYKDRLFTRILMLLKAQSDPLANFLSPSKQFDEMEWDKRATILAFSAKRSEQGLAKKEPTKGRDVELELQLKMLAKKDAPKPEGVKHNLEQETYVAVLRVLGMLNDVNLLSQYVGGEMLFRRSFSTEQAAAKLPLSVCLSEKDFRNAMEQWNLMVYEMSGGSKSDHAFFKNTPETKVRWDINNLKVFYSADVDAVMEEGKQKLAVTVSKIFQECLGKPQPGNPHEWATGYLNFLAKMEAYLAWISEQLRK